MSFEERIWLERILLELAHIREQNRILLERTRKIMADVIVTQEQVDAINSGIAKIGADLDTFGTDITAVGNDVAQVLQMLKDAQATGTRVDLTTAINLLGQADANIDNLDTKLNTTKGTMDAVINNPPPPPPVNPVITVNDDGTTTSVLTNPDGSVTTTITNTADGTVISTVTTPPPAASPSAFKFAKK